MPIDHHTLRATVQAALEPLGFVHSLWEAGSTAFGRNDEWSDLDLTADVDEGQEDATFAAVEEALERLAPIELKWVIPVPASHGMHQRFYRLAGTPPYLMVDLTLRRSDQPEHFAEREMHGEPVVLFDKRGQVRSIPMDRTKLAADVERRLASIRVQVPLLEHLVTKELDRGHPLDALGYYQALVLRPLVELLRIRYHPERHGFGLRYLTIDLPADVVARIEALAYVPDPHNLRRQHAEAVAWCMAELAALDTGATTD
jgi:predicted nucleotidyltransferase